MLQLTQTLRSGSMQLVEVPYPAVGRGQILVRTHYSVVSPGTEGRSVRDARRGYIGKARARRAEVAKLLGSLRTRGLIHTYRSLSDRLDALSGLGYCAAGEVIAVGAGVDDVAVGEHVACGGPTAVHAEVIAVPRNLSVKVPRRVNMRTAAFTTLGAVALQGLRQAEVTLGSNCVVIGLGLLGRLSIQLLEAAGVRSIGIDIDPGQVARAQESGAHLALLRGRPDLEAAVLAFTNGAGADAVIIAAATRSTDPLELAAKLCRQKGRVVIVGDVMTSFRRDMYYRKELELRMSCSYGPGRYDPQYEQHGLDYPIGYVRWTENRNMEAFLGLTAAGKLAVDRLISHTIPFRDAPSAYRIILEKTEPYAGILLEYDVGRPAARRVDLESKPHPTSKVKVGLVGAGSFSRNVLLPILKSRAELVGVATARPNNARYVADRFGFRFCTGDAQEVLDHEAINTIMVTTRHDMHASLVLDALRRDLHVYVEKPLCINEQELAEIAEEYSRRAVHLMVGFNRRFSRHTQAVRQFLSDRVPKAIQYRINAAPLPTDHWVHDAVMGGGRVVGEVCHFIDVARYLAASRVERVMATAMADAQGLRDTLAIIVAFEDGSIASISYFSNGNGRLPKERIEVFAAGQAAVIDDFTRTTLFGVQTRHIRSRTQDKGHEEEIARFLAAVLDGGPPPIPFEEIHDSMKATFLVLESLKAASPSTPDRATSRRPLHGHSSMTPETALG